MRKTLSVLLLLLCPASAIAEDFTRKFTGLERGKSYELSVDQDGVFHVSPLEVVVVGKPSPKPPPVDPDPVDPDGDQIKGLVSSLTKDALAAGGTKNTGAALSSVYLAASEAVKQGKVKPSESADKVKDVLDAVMILQADRDAWRVWRTTISEAIATAESNGSLQTADQYAAMYKIVGDGVKAAVGFQFNPLSLARADAATARAADAKDGKADGILDGITWEQIFALIQLILKLFGLGV
jgi:hypothetical protein